MEKEEDNTPKPFIYLSGPMSGMPDNNRENFAKAEVLWRKKGYDVFNPTTSPASFMVKNDPDISTQDAYRICMGVDTAIICQDATDMYMLNGWYASKGAKAEYALAECLGLNIHYQSQEEPVVYFKHT